MGKYNKDLNYCTFSPEEIFGVKFNFGCYLHDRQYRNEVKIRKTRKQADKQLQKVICKILKNSKEPFEISIRIKKKKIIFFVSNCRFFIWLRKQIAYPWSMVYYFAVRLFALFAWEP